MIEARKADPWDPEPSAARLAPWGFSTGVVDSLGEGFGNSKTLKVNGSLIRQ